MTTCFGSFTIGQPDLLRYGKPKGRKRQPSLTGHSWTRRKPFEPSGPEEEEVLLQLPCLNRILEHIGEDVVDEDDISKMLPEDLVTYYFVKFYKVWQKQDRCSYLAFEGLLYLLETALETSNDYPILFSIFINLSQDDCIEILTKAFPWLIDAAMLHGCDLIDIFLTSLAVYSVQSGRNLLAEFIKAIPYFSGFYLGEHNKRFEELFAYIHTNQERKYDLETSTSSVVVSPHYLTCMHFPARKIVVSNAPPVKLRKSSVIRLKSRYNCDVAAGGLVSGIKPSLESQDVWVSYLDPSLVGMDRMPQDIATRIMKESFRIPRQVRRSPSISGRSQSSDDEDETYNKLQDFLWEKTENDWLGLQKRLDAFSERNFTVNPLVIMKDDHKPFYNGISNGLLWPAFHNLHRFIIDPYQSQSSLATQLFEDWEKYIKVNFHFAIHTARSCRSQDFIWIHDYHLFLVGQILRSLNPRLNSAFFLHIPFGLSGEFMKKYQQIGLAILRGLLGFKQVGFQTSRDCTSFVNLCQKHLDDAVILSRSHDQKTAYVVRQADRITDVGTFPIGVKTEAIVQVASDEKTHKNAMSWKQKILSRSRSQDGGGRRANLFLSVERFDYTKGILERLSAIDRYFEKYPDRIGLDVFYQIAAASRSDVSAYKIYQAECLQRVEKINTKYGCKTTDDDTFWVPVVIDRVNHPQDEVVALYQSADVIVVTPIADGMNLVIKEAVLSNPNARLVLSVGAGAEQQFREAGLGGNYFRIKDIKDVDTFAEILMEARKTPTDTAVTWGQNLYQFVVQHDIGKWISSQTNPQGMSDVIPNSSLVYNNPETVLMLLQELQEKRREIIGLALVAEHVGDVYDFSLKNACQVLKRRRKPNGTVDISYGKDKYIEVTCDKIINNIEMDLCTMRWFKRSCSIQEYHNELCCLSGLSEEIYFKQLEDTETFLNAHEYIDTVITLYDCYPFCNVPDCTSATGCGAYENLQSLTNGLLLTLFANRYATHNVILSSMTDDEVREGLVMPTDTVLLHITANLVKEELSEGSTLVPPWLLGHSIMVLCDLNKGDKIVEVLAKYASSICIVDVGVAVTQSYTPATTANVSKRCVPEVMVGAMVKKVLKPIVISGGAQDG